MINEIKRQNDVIDAVRLSLLKGSSIVEILEKALEDDTITQITVRNVVCVVKKNYEDTLKACI